MDKKRGFASLSPAMRKLASAKGGRAKVPKGFSMNPELASKVGAIGGKKSKRRPNLEQIAKWEREEQEAKEYYAERGGERLPHPSEQE